MTRAFPRQRPHTSTPAEKEFSMTRAFAWQRLVLAAFTLATLALLLYTIGAPQDSA
jgi:hypothetical protein